MAVSTSPDSYRHLNFPHFSQPVEVDAISLHGKDVMFDRRNLKHFWEDCLGKPMVPFNLSVDFEKYVGRCDQLDKKYLEPLFTWIQHRAESSPAAPLKELVGGADFVCWRGLLQRVLNTPYEGREGWLIGCMRVGDVIFMYEYDTAAKIERESNLSDRERRMCYWGYKFETYVTLDTPDQDKPDTSAPCGQLDQYCTLVRSRLGTHHRLFYGAEVDGISAGKYIELKTTRLLNGPNQRRNMQRHKFIKWWTQSFLVGIQDIVVGFRNDDGFVTQVEKLPMRQIEKDGRQFWSSAVCFNFLEAFLSMLKAELSENSSEKVYVVEWKPGMKKLKPKLLEKNSNQANEYRCVPEWFAQKFGTVH